MRRPLISSIRRQDIPLYNLYYLHAPRAGQMDPTIVWGTEVETAGLQHYLRQRNANTSVLLSTSHVLLKATAMALAEHPELNRRVVGRRIYDYRDLNVRMAYQNSLSRQVDVMLIEQADRLNVEEIAGLVWKTLMEDALGRSAVERDRRRIRRLPGPLFHALMRVYGWLDQTFPLPTFGRLEHLRSSAVLVNDLSFHGAPPMCSYKPTRFPDEGLTLNVTLGPEQEKALIRNGEVVVGTVAPLFVRADHRLTDAYGLARFVAALRDRLQSPHQLDLSASDDDQVKEDCRIAAA